VPLRVSYDASVGGASFPGWCLLPYFHTVRSPPWSLNIGGILVLWVGCWMSIWERRMMFSHFIPFFFLLQLDLFSFALEYGKLLMRQRGCWVGAMDYY
jgi:hypothetical protein